MTRERGKDEESKNKERKETNKNAPPTLPKTTATFFSLFTLPNPSSS
jgi:hypothetical protein